MRFFLCALCCVLYSIAGFGQEYGYTHYDSKDGLAGSTVYCMVQDRDGFLWFGTEVGLSRFDGTHFKNFTKADGLPDNEIIQLFADSKGRVWIAPFKKSICYYYQGKIHTQENDPVLKSIANRSYMTRFTEDKAGNILLQEYNRLHLVDVNDQVTTFDSVDSQPIFHISATGAHPRDGFMAVIQGRLYDLRNKQFQQRKTIPVFDNHFMQFAMNGRTLLWRRDSLTFQTFSFDGQKTTVFPFSLNHVRFNIIDDHLLGECLTNGAVIYYANRPDSARYFLPGLPVSSILKDTEGSLWFTTLGHGVYRLSSPVVLNIPTRKNNLPSQVLALGRQKDHILASSEWNFMYSLNRKTGKLEKEKKILKGKVYPVTKIINYKDNFSLFGTALAVYKYSNDLTLLKSALSLPVKDFSLAGNKLYVATTASVFVFDPETLKATDSFFHERATAVYAFNDTVYVGTLNGLYCFYPDRSTRFLGEKLPVLKNRITNIRRDAAGVLWVGTSGDGIIGYKNGRIVAAITQLNGLTSNICRTLYLCGNHLWVGTDKGLNKINIAQPGYPVIKYTTGDGLNSDVINAIYVDSNKVFVGTPEGITFFDEEKIISNSRCDLRFTDIVISGETWYPGLAPALIPHEKNSMQFNFAGISYKSTGDIRYRYRLLGLDSTWKETRETFLSYPTLPSGDYQLQLQAINKFDVSSRMLTARFTIDELLYERTWFRLLIGVLFLAAVGLLIMVIIRRIRKREREKTVISRRMSELEQLSRKAQMNPHFIFNSLNSIQQYVMDSDVAGANKFIAGFSRLIRQTLDFSSEPEISLEEELDYLSNYLELERTRLENTFSWSVSIEEGVDPAGYYIPPMILQPFVENSVRHGLRFRRDKNGKITITVKRENNSLVCILEDNGVGRKAAGEYKSISPINYQSKGLSLTADRIALFNQESEQKIYMHIDDLEDNFHNSLGTRVTIIFPVF
jgi:hypothetical protein